MIVQNQIGIHASDVSGQNQVEVEDVREDALISEVADSLISRMQLPRFDTSGRPLSYQIRLEREGRHLNRSERVGDALLPNDRVSLLPSIDAGGNPGGRG
jgi:hypothetical protein